MKSEMKKEKERGGKIVSLHHLLEQTHIHIHIRSHPTGSRDWQRCTSTWALPLLGSDGNRV